MAPTTNEAYKQGRAEIEVASQRLMEIRALIAGNEPMTRRKWNIQKTEIQTTTQITKIKKIATSADHQIA